MQAPARDVSLSDVAGLDARIRIDRFVAEGGFGRVYKGHHRTLDRDVAIKVLKIPAEYGDGARAMFCERFAQEARIIARLDHPAVVRVLDFGIAEAPGQDPAPYMILDWLDGITLKELIGARRKEGRLFDRDETLQLLTPVLEALSLAHAQGIVHRDITPGNLMLVETPTGPALRLLDFGIAKVMADPHAEGREGPEDNTHTHTALLAFSPRWASPEQAGRGRTGPWTDVHGIALLCTAMLTGEHPYRGTRETLFQAIFSETRPTPAAFGVDAGAWEPVLARAVSLRPELRQPDAGTLLRELQDAVFASAQTRVVSVPASVRAGLMAAPAPVSAAALTPTPAPRGSPTLYAIAGAVVALLVVAAALAALLAHTPRDARSLTPPSAPVAPIAAPAPVVSVAAPTPPTDPVQQLLPPPAPEPADPAPAPAAPGRRHATRRTTAHRIPEPGPEPVPAASTPSPQPSVASPRATPRGAASGPRIQPLRDYP